MLPSEKKFADKMLKAGKKLPKDMLFHAPGELVKLFRKRLRMTQQQLAHKCRLPQSYIAKLESGKARPSWNTLTKIFKVLGCSITLMLIPEFDLDFLLEAQAYMAAAKRVKYVAGTMTLEEQAPSQKSLKEMVKEEQKRLLDSGTSRIWNHEECELAEAPI